METERWESSDSNRIIFLLVFSWIKFKMRIRMTTYEWFSKYLIKPQAGINQRYNKSSQLHLMMGKLSHSDCLNLVWEFKLYLYLNYMFKQIRGTYIILICTFFYILPTGKRDLFYIVISRGSLGRGPIDCFRGQLHGHLEVRHLWDRRG